MTDDQQAGGAAEPAPQKGAEARSPEADGRARNEPPRADGDKADGDEVAAGNDAPEEGDVEQDQMAEHERAAGRFKEHTRDPLAEEQGEDGTTDLAAASRARRATRMLFDTGRDLNSFDRSFFQSAHIGDIHLRMDARHSGAGMRGGPVPDEELRRLRRVHVEPQGYVQLRKALNTRRLLVLGAAPGTGRTSTALSLLDEVTGPAADATGTEPVAGSRVRRVDPDGGVRQLTRSLAGESEEARRGTGYLLELPLTGPVAPPPDEMDLDGLAAALAGCEAYAVVVVTVGSAANPLLAGRYGRLCPPAPTQELLTTRLRERLEEHVAAAPDGGVRLEDLLAGAEELALRQDVKDAVGLKDLRPAEAELLASLLAGHQLGEVSRDELLAGCRSLAADQAQEWFAGVDRALTAPPAEPEGGAGRPGTAALFHPVAFRIALAVLGGASHSAVAAAAHLLTWELSVQCDPDHTPARPLFCDDPEADLALSRAELTDGRIEVAGTEVPARLIWYRGSALPSAVLTEIWDRHFPVRAPIVRWLRLLADDPRPQVWMRAAVAAGELCARDFDHGYAELIRPLAEAATPRRRIFAATTLDQAAGHASHRKAVLKLVDDWSRYGTKSLRWTAAMALGYGNAADTTDDALDALARIGVRDDGEHLAVASFNAVRLLALPDGATVLRRMADWTHHKREAYQDLGLVTTVRLALTSVDEVLPDEPDSPLADRPDWPLPLALAVIRPELVLPMADLMWSALSTARSKDVALDALESLLRSGVRKDGTEGTRPGLAALLPALVTKENDRRRLDWLLRRMMNDPENPLPDAQARSLWWLAVPPKERTGEEDSHG
ncbi:hypothetical protein OG585_34980 [Streptomyces sp. NBC_01340]|uniref:hypothetical protein n=1 Tax=unclassified Streptomyces TaxID=2593676 RepID=UPI002252C2C7|nr:MULTISPECIES: hypothetical protein [unclassified Streptomyces]MCX4457772.1 hypothetical protein [Streptomyces sp. NBC_01719]MCX4497129.1 hypothetical protein [Streptomyces sp. NBC_01728]WSI41990.1 hypothetical protein OG585_34980 [Streptomyces sp. NBC_01340]